MAHLNSTPDNFSITLNYSTYATFATGAQVKLVPKNIDGTVFDCTGMNAASLNYFYPSPGNAERQANQPITVGTADATGIVLSLTPAQATAIAATMTNTNAPADITISNGTDTMIAGKGNVALNLVP